MLGGCGFRLSVSTFLVACSVGMVRVMGNVHVGVQFGREPAELLRADAAVARWDLDIDVVERLGQLDFLGPAVQGKGGERIIYLTWGDVGPGHRFEMFRRAKLMLRRFDHAVMGPAVRAGRLSAMVDLTGADGSPRCARVDPPAKVWAVPLL